MIYLAFEVRAHDRYAPRYGYYPATDFSVHGGWKNFNLVTQPVSVVWIREEETVVDGFVVARKAKGHGASHRRAKFVAKALCVFGICSPLDPSEQAEVEIFSGLYIRDITYLCCI